LDWSIRWDSKLRVTKRVESQNELYFERGIVLMYKNEKERKRGKEDNLGNKIRVQLTN
jgi:hypothetical protein